MSSQPPTSNFEPSAVQALAGSEANLADALGKYRVLGALGQGGMADVYLAVADGPEGFRKLCVVKLLKEEFLDDADFRAMFLDEARLAARLNHPNIVQTFEVEESGGRLLLAMEYVEGQPLTRVVRHVSSAQLPLTASVRILCDVLEALDYAHTLTDYDGSSLGIVHRDVTPHNLLIGYDGRVKLVDFGIAKSAAALQLTQAGVVKGKVGYMAPEQATGGEVDGRADVFSVGVMLWEMIAHKRLTAGLSGRETILRRIGGGEPKIGSVVPSVDPRLAAICDKAMATDPDERFAHSGDMQLALEQWLSTQKEPSRKIWSAELRRTFEAERKQLRALIDQRLRDAGVSASLRPSYPAANATSSILALSPDAASRIARVPSVPPSGTGSASIPARSVSLPPSAPRSWLSLAVGASMLAMAVAALVYVTQMQNAPMLPPAAATPPPAPAASAELVAPASPPSTEPSAGEEAEEALDPTTLRPHPAGAPRRGPGPARGAASAGSAPRPADAPPKPKASARPLDEQDPYR